MTVRIVEEGKVELVGNCGSEDAEALLRLLSANPTADVDWRGCEGAHTAVVQVLVAARVRPLGSPTNRFLADMVAPLLGRS
jgi:hypothetical protein